MIAACLLFLNRIFRRPNVGGRESSEAYSQWEHYWGRELVRGYLEPAGDLDGKNVLDVGCGLGGKTVAYREGGAAAVAGTDLLEENAAASERYAESVDVAGSAFFFASDASSLPLRDGAFDTVVANDAMEHFARPARSLAEMARVTRPGGAIWLFFTPHYSPLGSHLYDYIYTPWCHLLFGRRTIERAVARVLAGRGETDVAGRTRAIMASYDNDLNHMSVRWFLRIVRRLPGVQITLLELRPAKFAFLKPLTLVPLVRELFTAFVVCRLEKVA